MLQNPAEQTQKLTAMEDELTILRQQIAMLVEAQEQINKSQSNPLKNSNLYLDFFFYFRNRKVLNTNEFQCIHQIIYMKKILCFHTSSA
jgi:hypothetical protein